MSRGTLLVATAAALLVMGGCATSRKITTRSELASLAGVRPITVYAREDRVYRLVRHALGDSAIEGSGTMTQRVGRVPFEGSIPFGEIIAVKTDSRSFMKGLAVAGLTAVFLAQVIEGTGSSDGLTVTEDVRYIGPSGGGGTSCPHVYAWDGARYTLQAEPFGTAWGRALTLTTVHLLPAAREESGVVRLRLANERPETHYIDSIQLFAIHLGASAGAVLDVEGRAWSLSRVSAPSAAHDEKGRDLLPEIAAADGRMWECDASSLTVGSGYDDVLELEFARPRDASAGSLILTGTNTDLWSVVYGQVCRWFGDHTAVLAHAVETDPELIATLRAYLRDASLEVMVWNGRGWKAAGAFSPEASSVTFTRALRIHIPEAAGDTVRLRLRSLADVWKLDAITVDWSVATTLPMEPVPLSSAIGPQGEDLRDVIGGADGRHAVLLPPERVELTFASIQSTPRKRVAYALAGRGYLHPWEPDAAVAGIEPLILPVPEERRVELLKEFLRHRDLALEAVYDEWRKVRAREPSTSTGGRDGRMGR